ncbi:MAG: hypothetical protein ACXV4A_15680 [Actinomycetes bacterium]
MKAPRPRRWRTTPGATGLALGTVLGLLALGPALRRGYLLSYDMVFVPHQPLTATVLGTDGSVPRSVPNDLLVVLASHVLPGDVVQKALLLAAFSLAGWGIGRLMPTRLAAAVATCAFTWNAYVFERLVIGHWGFLLGLAALPWAAGAAIAVRRHAPGAIARLCLVLALVGLGGSTALVLNALLVLVLLLGRGWRSRLRGLALVALVTMGAAAPWLVPALQRPGSVSADPGGVAAFAARADTPLGVLPSLLTSGGIWNPAVWPAERGSVVVALGGLLIVVAAAAAGAGPLLHRWGAAGSALLAAGGVGLVLSVAGAVPVLETGVRLVVVDVPGGGLIRDGQKFVALTLLPLALCAGLAAQRAAPHLRRGAWLLLLLPIAVLPSLAWGAHGRLEPVAYPVAWQSLRAEVNAATRQHPGSVAVFPFTYYRRYAWNRDRVVLDPMARFLDADVVENDDLPLTGRVVRGEDQRAARIRAGLSRDEPIATVLAAEHVGYVVDQLDQPDVGGTRARLRELPLLWQRGELALRAVPASHRPAEGRSKPLGVALGALTLGLAIAVVLRPRLLRRCYARRS